MRLVVGVAHLRLLKFIIIQQLANVLVVLIVRPEPINQAPQVHGFGKGVCLRTWVTDETFYVQTFGDLH
jgi:hypothetical protein